MRIFLITLLLIWIGEGAHAQNAALFPFVLPWDDATHTIIDVGALNPAPAGKNGFITARNGHFVDGQGHRVRFLGVNFTFNANFPDKADAEKVAARLHKFGINIVRMHHMDFYPAPQGIWDPRYPDRQHLDKDQLDRMDYLVYQLKRHGIYVNINLHVSRAFTAADGFPDTDKLPDLDKVVVTFEPRMIRLQQAYARDLLTHVNPYTKSRYADDPEVAVVEIDNEDTLLGAAWDGTLDRLPPYYKTELTQQWNGWLQRKYAGDAAWKRAWSADDRPLGPNLLQNADFTQGTARWTLELNQAPAQAEMQATDTVRPPPGAPGKVMQVHVTTLGAQSWHIQLHQTGLDLRNGDPYTVSFWAKADRARPISVYTSLDRADWHNTGLSEPVDLTPEWRKFSFTFTAARAEKAHNRLSFTLGEALGTVDLAGVVLQPGMTTAIPEGASPEAGTVPMGRPVNSAMGRDWIAFLMDAERRYVTAMRATIKKELGSRANVIGSQASYGGLGGLWRESKSDFDDMHAYWQHPDFPHRPWDPVDWRILNTSMTRAADGGTLSWLARYRLAGKPFTVSEYNHPAPNDYQAECVPMLAAFAAAQDWDGLYLFDYNGDRNAWNSDKIKGFFSVDTNPAKMVLLPAAAMLFLRGDMPPASGERRLQVPAKDVAALLARNGQDVLAEWEAAGIHPADLLTQRVAVVFKVPTPVSPSPPTPLLRKERGAEAQANSTPFPLGNGERVGDWKGEGGVGPLAWRGRGTEQAVFTAYAPASAVIVGSPGESVRLAGWQVDLAPGRFAALTLSTVDGRPMARSRSLLLTAVGRVENTGMQWNADRTSVGDHWGTGPTLAEGISAKITVRTQARSAAVYALDGTGKRTRRVDASLSGGQLTFSIGPAYRTLWYEIETR